jgi:phosphoribosylformylglycinamidine (FGAM) synthase-like amidotransferase family enzyme
MKNQLKSLIAAFVIGATTLVNANNTMEPTKKSFAAVVFKSEVTKSMNVFINKEKGSVLEIVVKDAEGNILYDDVMGKTAQSYRTKFRMDNLPKGTYSVEMTDGKNKEIKEVDIK